MKLLYAERPPLPLTISNMISLSFTQGILIILKEKSEQFTLIGERISMLWEVWALNTRGTSQGKDKGEGVNNINWARKTSTKCFLSPVRLLQPWFFLRFFYLPGEWVKKEDILKHTLPGLSACGSVLSSSSLAAVNVNDPHPLATLFVPLPLP